MLNIKDGERSNYILFQDYISSFVWNDPKENNMPFKEECAGIILLKYFISLLACIGYVCWVCVTALIRRRATT
jgi:hypothetical protein